MHLVHKGLVIQNGVEDFAWYTCQTLNKAQNTQIGNIKNYVSENNP